MYINSKNKQLQLEPLRGIITQGEKLADTVTFALPNVYGSLTLSSLGWSIRAASEKNTLATASLTVSVMEDKCLLSWEVSSDFTAVSGALSLMLVGTDGDGNVVIKFPGDSPIWVRDSETGEYSPPEDAIENALNGLQSAEEALQNAIEALQSIGVNLKILGWYPTLEALQAAVTNPSPGDIYGIGDPTVLYVWTGSAWTQLPGVFVQSSGYNPQLLDNAYFVGGGSQQSGGQLPVNQKGQDSYTASQNTVSVIDRFKLSNSGTLSLTPGGVELYGYNDPDPENRVYCNFEQIVDSGIYNSLSKRQITASALGSGNFSLTLGVNGTYPIRKNYNSETIGLTTVTYTLPQSITEISVVVQLQNSSPGTATILAEKLELGTQSTLAHLVNGKWILNDPPPNFEQELAKCQREYQLYSSAEIRPSNGNDCRPVMRLSSPSQGTIIISGQTWYYNDASL